MKKLLTGVLIFIGFLFLIFNAGRINYSNQTAVEKKLPRTWPVKSVDTMKYSRDMALEYQKLESVDEIIDAQVKSISSTGANYLAIGTPYDEPFIPILKKWTESARKYRLNIWFRGNFSGWQGWFNHKKITSNGEHIKLISEFISKNNDLFENGDIFDPCPECENGGSGDPRDTKRVKEYRNFLINERTAALAGFQKISKEVNVVYSMNFDVAKLIMDKETARALGGLVVIDHYVKSPRKLSEDITYLANEADAQILLGEFGAPIPDIHGVFSEQEQADWINQSLDLISGQGEVIGLNYWVSHGGTTAIFNSRNSQKPAAYILEKYFRLESLP